MMIHLSRDGKDLGQFTIEQVNAMLAARQLRLTDFSWKEGMPNWVALALMEGVVPPPASTARSPSSAAPRATTTPQGVYAPPRSVVSSPGQQPGQVSQGSIRALRETRPWVLFLAILGTIGSALMLLGVLALLMMGGIASSKLGLPVAGIGLLAIFYLILALLYLYPIVKLFKYSGAIQRLTQTGAAADLDDALQQQKSFWKFVGILTLVMIVLNLVIFLVLSLTGVKVSGMGGTPTAGWSLPPPPLTSPR